MIIVNVDKAKDIAHSARREARSKEFAPLDIQATIPFMAEEAEAKRQVIRDKYAELQNRIDASDVDGLYNIMKEIGGV
jgi:hypothetical protein